MQMLSKTCRNQVVQMLFDEHMWIITCCCCDGPCWDGGVGFGGYGLWGDWDGAGLCTGGPIAFDLQICLWIYNWQMWFKNFAQSDIASLFVQ